MTNRRSIMVAFVSVLLVLVARCPQEVVSFSMTTTGAGAGAGAVGFDGWIEDAPEEVLTPRTLLVQGEIPGYVQGSLIRNGCGIWTMDDATQCGHIFDGLAKVSRYQIGSTGVTFTTRFVDSRVYQEWVHRKSGTPTLLISPRLDRQTLAPIKETRWLKALLNIPWFDNAPVNVWDFHPHAHAPNNTNNFACLTDTPIRATLDKTTLLTIQTARQPPAPRNNPGLYELTGTAHPEYCKKGTGATYNVGTMLALPHYQLCLIRDQDGSRQVVAQIPLPDNQIPYLHSFGLTPTKAILLLQPFRQNPNIFSIIEQGYFPSMLHVNETRVIVVDVESGEVVADTNLPEPVYFYHSISAAEINNHQVAIQLCAYPVPDIMTGPDAFLKFDRASTRPGRNRIYHPGGTLCHLTIHLDTNQATLQWTPVVDTLTKTRQGFELPTTRYSRDTRGQGPWQVGKHARFAYAFGNFARGSTEYDSWALYKIDTATGDAMSLCQPNAFYSEPIFVADPHGQDEDDGVLLCTCFQGQTQQTSFLVVHAKTMTILAQANTETRMPMDFHGAFFPNQ
jgi:beta,beta-carotene 9',10'-dioxygenase